MQRLSDSKSVIVRWGNRAERFSNSRRKCQMNLRSTGFRAMEKTEVPKGGTHVEPGEHLSASTLLTGQSFWDETVFHEELERFYFRSWLNGGLSGQIQNTGGVFLREIG